MTARLVHNAYGKSRVRLVKVLRGADRHDLLDLDVAVRLEGAFGAAYTEGDNASVLPTDTLKNTVYALARRFDFSDPEELGLRLTAHFLERVGEARQAEMQIVQRPWTRLSLDGAPHPHAFEGSTGERRTAGIAQTRGGEPRVSAGLDGLLLLKTTGSGFSGFPRDEYTRLPETDDRILATVVEATWRYREPVVRFGRLHRGVRERLVSTFARHDDSRSVQHTLWEMGQAVLDAHEEVEEIRLVLPNKHHLPADLAGGLDNPDQVFVATDEPYGLIEGTVSRAGEV